jgi:hypothetical protein
MIMAYMYASVWKPIVEQGRIQTFKGVGTASVVMCPKHLFSKICAAAILCSGGGVSAQTIYKLMDANGHTTFTNRPAEGIVVPYGKSLMQESDSAPPSRVSNGTRPDLAKALVSNSPMTSLYAATIDFSEATRRLRQARQSLQEGIQSRPREQTDGGGTGAINKRYMRRQQRLEREVVAAERRAHETSLVRSALWRRVGGTDPLILAQP